MYQPIKFSEFEYTMQKIGAVPVELQGVGEVVFEMPVKTKSGREFPETIRVYSTVSASGMHAYSRKVGTDAIRVVLVRDGRVLISAKRVNRSGKPADVLNRVVDRMRAAWKFAANPENRGPSGHLFTKGRFIE